VDILWCQGAQNIGLCNRKPKSALSAPYDQNVRIPDKQTDGRTDEHHGNSTVICYTNALHTKNGNSIMNNSTINAYLHW